MDADQLKIGERAPDFLGSSFRHIFVGGAVKAVAAKAGIAPFGGNRIGRREVRIGEMEGRVEDRDLWEVGPQTTTEPDSLQIGRKVQRGEWRQGGNGLHRLVVEKGRRREFRTAMDDAVSHRLEPVEAEALQGGGHARESFAGSGKGGSAPLIGFTMPEAILAGAVTTTLVGPLEHHVRIDLYVEEAELEAGPADDEDEYLHAVQFRLSEFMVHP